MIDFTPCAVNKFKGYGGANGNKINIIYQNESYMLKFPLYQSRQSRLWYINSVDERCQVKNGIFLD